MKLGPDFAWTPEEEQVLVGLRAILKADIDKKSSLLKHLLRLVAGHDGEISISFIRNALGDFDIPVGSNRDNKANKLMHRLVELEWVYIRSENRWHPRQADGSQSQGQARSYGVGAALRYKFEQGDSSNLDPNPQVHLLLRHYPWHEGFSQEELQELATEYARLKAPQAGVEPLDEEEQKALTANLGLAV